jgi:hypothetical protein
MLEETKTNHIFTVDNLSPFSRNRRIAEFTKNLLTKNQSVKFQQTEQNRVINLIRRKSNQLSSSLTHIGEKMADEKSPTQHCS